MTTALKNLIPKQIRPPLGKILRQAFHQYHTLRLFGQRAGFVPPTDMMFDGPESYREFKENGEEFLRIYIDHCQLKPDEKMLDVGSGMGRKTLPLISYLTDVGRYEGMDIVKAGVDWCTARYSSRYPNFKFQTIDVYNQHYNPTGTCRASAYKFPFADQTFDFAVLNSVFTHMMPDEVENYIFEVARVLKTGQRCLISWFLLNDESVALIEAGHSTLNLRFQIGPARARSKDKPELAIGYDDGFVKALYEKAGLEIRNPISCGSWCGRQAFRSYQDLIVAWKR
jgi:SAM-dependent methyltransferase